MDLSNFLNKFFETFEIFSKFPKNVFLVQTRIKLKHGFLNYIENMLK